jgi:hypothetical protein
MGSQDDFIWYSDDDCMSSTDDDDDDDDDKKQWRIKCCRHINIVSD